MTIRLPYARPDVTPEDLVAAARAIELPALTQGPNLAAFESEMAAVLGVRHVVVCNSGTAALHLAYLALELGPDMALVTSPITFIATANAARMCGARVLFADVDPVTGNIQEYAARQAVKDAETEVGAIAAVHLGGLPCDMPALRRLADEFGCALLEDACHAPLAVYVDDLGKSYRVGACAHSDVAIFSFHAIKHVAMGEGGSVCTNNDDIAARVRLLRNHGMTRDAAVWQSPPDSAAPWYYEMIELGWNYRATEFECALGRIQLDRLPENLARRATIVERYREKIGDVAHLRLPGPPRAVGGHAWHLFSVSIDFDALGISRGKVMGALAERGVGSQVHYIPVDRQPFYQDQTRLNLPGAAAYYAGTLSLPLYASLSDNDVDDVVSALCAVLDR